MNVSCLLAAASPAGENVIQEISRTFGLNLHHLVAQMISFLIVAYCLNRFAYKPILRVLQDRRDRIAESLANADRIKAELARTETARQEVLAKAGAEGDRLIAEARAAAARVQEQETQKAVADAQRILTKANEEAVQTHARMLTELKREVGSLVVATTEKVTGKVLTPADRDRLAQETSKELAA
jgi:F-type H+-transporting ATPase subunit b